MTKLDDFVTLRGSIAHRGAAADSVTKEQCTSFLEHVRRLVKKTEAAVNNHMGATTGQKLFR